MLYFCIKVFLSAIIIAVVSELSKRNAFLGAILASVPLVTVLAMVWLYIDTHNPLEVAELAQGVLWMILPSLTLFLILPILLKQHMNFYLALGISIGVMIASYFGMVLVLKKFGVTL